MQIKVCIKQIIDPEIPSTEFKVDFNAKKAVEGQGELVLSPYDENAIEVALQLKDRDKDIEVTAVTAGGEASVKVLRKALAMGCDKAVWLKDPAADSLDSAATARVLAAGIRKAGGADIVLCGRQAGDWDMGLVGSMLAEELSAACVPLAYNIAPAGDKLAIKRETDKGMETLETTAPVLATITNDSSNQPRYPSVKGVMMAGRKEIPTWSFQELELGEDLQNRVVVDELTIPSYERQVVFIDGEDGPEKGVNLVEHLIKMNLIK